MFGTDLIKTLFIVYSARVSINTFLKSMGNMISTEAMLYFVSNLIGPKYYMYLECASLNCLV
jgi:hypothetical protein